MNTMASTPLIGPGLAGPPPESEQPITSAPRAPHRTVSSWGPAPPRSGRRGRRRWGPGSGREPVPDGRAGGERPGPELLRRDALERLQLGAEHDRPTGPDVPGGDHLVALGEGV